MQELLPAHLRSAVGKAERRVLQKSARAWLAARGGGGGGPSAEEAPLDDAALQVGVWKNSSSSDLLRRDTALYELPHGSDAEGHDAGLTESSEVTGRGSARCGCCWAARA